LDYWVEQINAGVFTLENTRAAFTDPAQTEYTEIYGGLDNTQFVTAIYENFLERAPDIAGLLYWVGELDSGRVNADQMINAIINAVQDPNGTGEESNTDLAVLKNKIAAALYFTEQSKAYFLSAAFNEAARAAVSKVTDDLETIKESRVVTDEFVISQSVQNEKRFRAIHLGGFCGANHLGINDTPEEWFDWVRDLNVEWAGLSATLFAPTAGDSTVEPIYPHSDYDVCPTLEDEILRRALRALEAHGIKTYLTLALENKYTGEKYEQNREENCMTTFSSNHI
jgi:hypothetical protein